jgi:hypothetical protein
MNGGEVERVYVIGRKPEGKRSLGRPRQRWVNNIKVVLAEIEWGGLD